MKRIIIKQDELPIEIMSTMGCRTQNGADINGVESYRKNVQSVIQNGKLYDNYISCAQKDGRGNICPVTIIMPTLAMEAKEYVMKNSEPFSEDLESQAVDKFLEILRNGTFWGKSTLWRPNYIAERFTNKRICAIYLKTGFENCLDK